MARAGASLLPGSQSPCDYLPRLVHAQGVLCMVPDVPVAECLGHFEDVWRAVTSIKFVLEVVPF